MQPVRSSAPLIADVEPYDPKSLPAEVFISANESPYDVPAEVKDSVLNRLRELPFNRYPDPMGNRLRDMIAQANGLQRGNVLLANGGDELLFNIFLAWGGQGRTCLNFTPTFSVYAANAHLTGTAVENMERVGDDFHIDVDAAVKRLSQGDIDLVILTSPNNPTGCATPLEDVRRILQASDALVLVDEAYGEFGGQTALPLLAEYENLLILHTFSKAFSCAGVRLGYFLGAARVISEFTKVRQPYSVDSLSQVVGEEVMAHRAAFDEPIASIKRERERLMDALRSIPGVQVHPTDANFVLVTFQGAADAWARLYDEHSVLVRNFTGSIPNSLRVTVGSPEENDKFIAALRQILG